MALLVHKQALRLSLTVTLPALVVSRSACAKRQAHCTLHVLLLSLLPCCRFRLHSVLVHSGGMHGGHYYSYTRTGDQRWLKFDDDKVLVTISTHLTRLLSESVHK